MVIFIFFKMAATAILDFQNFNFSTVRTFKRVELHHYAKFCRNHSNRNRDIEIFRFFKMSAAPKLDFKNFKILTVGTVKRVEVKCFTVPNFVKIGPTTTEIWRFFDLQDGGRRHLGF